MPENTEVLNMKDEACAPVVEKHDSGTDSDSDDSIPEVKYYLKKFKIKQFRFCFPKFRN